ncbi:MAG: hypothetical protein ACK4OF_00525 [Aquificaceae bacterium]
MEKNLLLLSRIRVSLEGYQVRVGGEYGGEEVVMINLEQFSPETIKSLKALGARVVAYCGHKNLELMNIARSMGADMVVPNSQMVRVKDLLLKFLP